MKKILIVEDTQILREEICDILTFEKYKVFEAKDGLDGLKKSITILPDLILSKNKKATNYRKHSNNIFICIK